MLTKIRVENYKSFKEAEIPIKPITILLGANSSGKTSILQLLLLLQQTAEEASASYKSALKIYGKQVSMGKPENLFYKQDSKTPISIQIDFKNEFLKEYLTEALAFYLATLFASSGERINNNTKTDVIEEKLKKIINSQKPLFNKHFVERFTFISSSDLNSKNIKSLILNYEFLKELHNTAKASSTFSFSFTISYSKGRLIVSAFSFKSEKTSILSYDTKGGFSSSITHLNEVDKESLNKAFLKNGTIFNIFGKSKKNSNNEETSLSKTMIKVLTKGLSVLQNEFKDPLINHVGPLRPHPQRYYMLDKASVTYSLDTYNANSMAEALKENKELTDRVNTWFEQFGLKVNVGEFQEAVHKLKVLQSSLQLDIPDVGFGISQVLPVVLLGFLSFKNTVTMVEQPEVHLHPKMQAALADLFIDITKESKFTKHLLIETHSEYLLRRLRRRMAEGEGTDKGISPDIVSINLFHTRTDDRPAIIENIPIENKGAFQWPQEYYDDELHADVVEFLKLQANGDIHSND